MDSPKTPPRSPPQQLPPPPPPAGSSGTPGASGASAWTTTDTRLKPYVLLILEELHMDDDTTLDEQYSFRYNVSKPLPLGGPPGQVTIQYDFFFNKDLEYLRYGRKSGRHALSISKMKAVYYPDVGLEQMVLDQMWIEEECKYDIALFFNSLIHSLRALSTLRRSGLRTASTAAKPCQGDSSEFYLITGRIHDGSSCWQETCQFTTPCSHLINMDSIMGKMCLGKDVIEISSDQNKGSEDWDLPKYKDTSGSGGKKEPKPLDGEINLEKNDNLISNDYAVKLCLEYEVRKGKKLVKKELMVLLHGEIYFVQFIINPEEDEFEPGLTFGRSILRSANAVVNFGEGTITIQPDFDPFLLSSDEEKNPNLDDLEMLLDFDFDEAPQTETDLLPLVCKMGKGSRNKKKVMENIIYFNNGVGPSTSVGIPLTQEEAKKRALAHNMSMRYEILDEVRPVIETLAYSDKYRKLLDEIWANKVRLDGMIKPKEERVMVKVKGQMLKEKKDPGELLFLIRLEGRIDENALADTGSDTNTMPYRIYEQLGRDDIMKENRNITMINYTEAEVTGRLVNVLCQVGFTTLSAKFLILEIPVDRDTPIVVGRGFLDTIGGNIDIPNKTFTTFDGLTRQTFRAARSEKIRIAESDSDDEEDYVIKRNEIGTPIHNSRPIGYQNNTNPAENMTLSTLESVINPFRKISVWMKARKCGALGVSPAHFLGFQENRRTT
ncbi:DNA-directed DNA polymerase [Tanacetum coccineum]|uniref:DNA-directed DNA polymerase n=1 Tax=Tanacetum coccineum TaxID=301880 RepID=A0ABQ4X6T0_9ASTR